MESGGRDGRGKGKKGKKKAVNTRQGGKKARPNAQVVAAGSKAAVTSTPRNATEGGPKNAKASQDQTLVKTKRKMSKKATLEASAMLKKQATGGTEPVKASEQGIEKPACAGATVKSHVASLEGAMKKKRKRNATLNASACTAASGRVTTAALVEEGPATDRTKSAQTMQKNGIVRGRLPSIATVAKQTAVVATSPKRRIAQVGKMSTKRKTQHAEKDERDTTTVDDSAAVASSKQVKAVGLSAGSMSVLPKDEFHVVVKKPQPKTEVRQFTGVANASKHLDSSVKGTLMLQRVQAAGAAITAKSKDAVTTTLCTNVTTTKKTVSNADSSPSTAAFDDKSVSSTPTPDASTRDPPTFSKPSYTASAAASPSTVRGKPYFQEPMPRGATSPPTENTKTSRALVASAFSSELATARLVTPPVAKSKVTGGHKRRRSIDQVSTNSVTDPLQPPTKRSAGSSTDAFFQFKANGCNEAQSSTDGKHAASGQLPRHHAAPQPVNTLDAEQETQESATKIVGGQATPTVKATPPLSKSAAGKLEKTELVNLRRPIQLLASLTPLEPSLEHTTSAALSNDSQPSAKQHEFAVKAEVAASAEAPSKDGGVGAPFESAVEAKEVGIVMDSRTYVQKMMSTDVETKSSHGDSSRTQSVQSIPRPRNAWGASFGMVPPAHGASSVSRTLSATPLSSWFLSKGCANFVKQVRFSDDDDAAGDSTSSEDDVFLTRQPSTLNGADKAPLKRRASATKTNAFLESLTTQSYWRSWYGTVDLHNLIDPPLVCVPDKLRTHEVTAFSLPWPRAENDSNTTAKKTNGLERLEADIRHEKQRGSAFSEQLLQMLQGKTVSGKSLEEEYRLLLH